jgi:serine/threonine protein phosphatase Stp1
MALPGHSPAGAAPAPSSAAWQARSVSRTHAGLVRARNEDNLVDRPEAGLWAVADGMGGHAGGERASALIRSRLEEIDPADDAASYVARVREALEGADGELRKSAIRSGSAVVVLLAAGDRYACVWAGDSRVYRLRGGRLERLTRDHSLVEELVASGTLKPELAHRHPLANRITRAVGVGDPLKLEVVQGRLAPGERYLLTSDGMHGVIAESVIAELLAVPDLDQASDQLMAAVMKAGAPDNVTVVLVAIDSVP